MSGFEKKEKNKNLLLKKSFKKELRGTLNRWQLYIMLLPAIIYTAIFCYKPMYGILIAFKNYSIRKGIMGSPWAGFTHFERLFNSYWFPIILKNTLTLSLLGLLIGFPLTIILALMLNELNRYYLRYEILQCLMNFLKNTELAEKAALMRECVNADITREREFMRTVWNILQHCLVEKEDDKFTRMLNYVNNNYQNFSLSVEEVAEVGGISKNYVSKVFRAHLDMSYIEYVTMVRMDKARTLLRTTDLKINDIAEQVGYINPVSFRRVFREKYGENASQYRKNEGKYKQD